MFNDQKQLDYSTAYFSYGTIGETLLINGTVHSKLTVPREKVRLRLLNGANARNFTFQLNNDEEIQQIATDGGFLNEPLQLKELRLTPSERAEIIIDFSKFNEGEKIQLVDQDGTVLLPFVIEGEHMESPKLPKKMNTFQVIDEEKSLPVTKEIELFGRRQMVSINGKKFDTARIDLTQEKDDLEVWKIYNRPYMMGGMIHPFDSHGAQFKIISRGDINTNYCHSTRSIPKKA